jgi:hypothetical protein
VIISTVFIQEVVCSSVTVSDKLKEKTPLLKVQLQLLYNSLTSFRHSWKRWCYVKTFVNVIPYKYLSTWVTKFTCSCNRWENMSPGCKSHEIHNGTSPRYFTEYQFWISDIRNNEHSELSQPVRHWSVTTFGKTRLFKYFLAVTAIKSKYRNCHQL